MHVDRNVPLASLTTFGLGGPADRCITASSEDEILEVVRDVDARGEPLLVVGGGSNLVVADAGFRGTVLRVASRGIDVVRDGATVRVTVAAGEPWDAFVARAASESWSGVECLAGIPGLVGAVPMQNVGAYGQDVGETIARVSTWDRVANARVDFDRAACGFSYRHSVFRGRDRHVVLAVTFVLRASPSSAPIRYAELARALGVSEGASAPVDRVRETVTALRRSKGMVLDPEDADTRSAGSFFTNPILDAASFEELTHRVRGVLRAGEKLPAFPEPDGRTKISAAWLIERAGFPKGFGEGRARISRKHALALTNRGGATTEELLSVARTIRDGVRGAFGVVLENEPVLVGVAL